MLERSSNEPKCFHAVQNASILTNITFSAFLYKNLRLAKIGAHTAAALNRDQSKNKIKINEVKDKCICVPRTAKLGHIVS